MNDTSCRKCKAPMTLFLPLECGVFAGKQFTVTGYRCEQCGHWNDLRRRKPNREAAE